MPRPPWRVRVALPPWILAGNIVMAVAALTIALLALQSLRHRAEESALARQTLRRLEAVEAVFTSLKNAETGQRGYLLTGGEAYLEPYRSGQAGIATALSSLRGLVAGDPAQTQRAAQLEELALGWKQFAQRTIDLVRSGDRAAAVELVRSDDRGKTAMDGALAIVATMETEETARLQAANDGRNDAISKIAWITGGGLGVLLLLILGVAYASGRAFRERETQDWLNAGWAALAADLSGNRSASELAELAIRDLASRLDAEVGAIHVVTPDGRFVRAGGYAMTHKHDSPEAFREGEGLVGQAALEKRMLEIREVPADYLTIRSGIGASKPRHVLVIPALVAGEVEAVIELGFFRRLMGVEARFLARAAADVASALRAARYHARQAELLEESQRQAEELQESQVQIEANQRELEEANAQLEAQTRTLQVQKTGLVETRVALEQQSAELERTSRYKSEFLANMSHELRTPLNSLLILAKILADNRHGNLDDDQVRYAHSIANAGNDLLALINDILDLSKIEARKIDLHVERVPISRILNELQARFGPLARERGLELVVATEPGCPEALETDRQRLQQVLTNLLSNALKFTERGSVRLAMSAHGARHVAFEVVDTGIGIAPEHHEVIFEAFRQADGTTNRRFGGTGLGLSISRELVALLGGKIQLRSTAGQGSTFTVIVPISITGAASSPVPVGPPKSAHATPSVPKPALVADDRDAPADSRRTVLVVEDDTRFAEILRDLGRELGFRCVVASDAAEGIRLAHAYPPAAVILDIGLPDHSGLTVLELLKRDPVTRHVPIHVVSVHDYQQVALELGAVGYTLKPVKREELVSAFRLMEERLARTLKRVLVVEDDPMQRDAITALLSADRVEIAAVEAADVALVRLREVTFDCCVLDLGLPGTTGFELLDQMTRDERSSFPPVIVYTARALTADEELRLRRYASSIIIKGARSPERLVEEVTLFLHQVEASLPAQQQQMLRVVRDRETVFEGRRILIAEDDARNIFALSKLLEPKGATIEIARTGREALVRLEQAPRIDLVLMDVMMPEMDGLVATQEIRKRDAHRALPIIALTSKAMPDDRLACLAAGASDYISKPVDIDKLMSLLRVWMPR